MHPMLNNAVRAAREAGNIMIRALNHGQPLTIDRKGQNDFVSEIDRQAEQAIVSLLRRAYPDHAILAEEGGSYGDRNDAYEWIIDPLDGTTNFLHGHPQFSVSIALRVHGRLEQAVVYDPLRQEIYTATQGRGAFLNDRRIRVANLTGLKDALLGTGFPFKSNDYMETYLNTFRALLPNVSDVRRAGSAALDLAYVAAGRLDGFWELALKPWDMAAGVLLIVEAGGIVTDIEGGNQFLESGHVVAGNSRVQQAILDAVSQHVQGLQKKTLAKEV